MKHLQTTVAALLAIALIGGFVYINQQPAAVVSQQAVDAPPADVASGPTATTTEIAQPSTDVPPTQEPTATDLPTATATAVVIVDTPTLTPERYYAEEIDLPTEDLGAQADAFNDAVPDTWNPQSMKVPLALHPYDHYWFIRPVAANFNNFGLAYYPYGSNGPNSDLRVHHGIDLSNQIGVEVFAAGSGTVIWADEGHRNLYETITTYGNTVVIEHDVSYNGEPVYTLYAHLSAIIAQEGDRVEMGDVVGLVGKTGLVTGPHVHFEVRVGRNAYLSVRNPSLWMAPYAGTGTVAGRLLLPDGEMPTSASMVLVDLDTNRTVYRTTSYANGRVPADDNWQENFVFSDVREGRYRVEASKDGVIWAGIVEVEEGMTNWVDMQTP